MQPQTLSASVAGGLDLVLDLDGFGDSEDLQILVENVNH